MPPKKIQGKHVGDGIGLVDKNGRQWEVIRGSLTWAEYSSDWLKREVAMRKDHRSLLVVDGPRWMEMAEAGSTVARQSVEGVKIETESV